MINRLEFDCDRIRIEPLFNNVIRVECDWPKIDFSELELSDILDSFFSYDDVFNHIESLIDIQTLLRYRDTEDILNCLSLNTIKQYLHDKEDGED